MITHSILPLAGSITKLEIITKQQLTALNNITPAFAINYSDIDIDGNWEEVQLTPDAGYKLKVMDTENGPVQNIELGGAFMNDDTDLFCRLFNRYIALLTDGDGKRFLVGNKTEYLKMEYETDSKNTRAQVKTTAISFKCIVVSPILLVL